MIRLDRKLRKTPSVKIVNAVTEKYGASAQMRWIRDTPIAPISYVQTKAPMGKKRSIQKYTPEGRKEIHNNLGMDNHMLQALLRQQLHGRSAEYADNRLSLFCAQL